jgi:signal transduction histidine kinase
MGLLGFDSLDALRASLTARLGRELHGRESPEEIGPVIGRLLLDESRYNERRIGALRVSLSTVFLGLAVTSGRFGGVGVAPSTLLAAVVWCGASTVLYVALRRGWYVSLLCGFLVFTGALRMTRVATRLSSGLAVFAFLAVAVIAHLSLMPTVGIVAGLLASSAFAGRVTEAIRRVIATEVSRLTMERQVDRANAQAAEARVAGVTREEVLRIVAHDLRNPLGTILMSADLLSEPFLTEELRAKQAAVVKRTGARMNRLIQDLLNVARIDTGGLSAEMKPIPPAQLVANAMELMQPLAAAKSLELENAVTEGMPDVNADSERIGQVFSNLIGNAIKFTPSGGRITLAAALTDGRVWFSVTDTGPGIPPEQVARVFGPFWQARRADNRGIGLGLTIAKGIVEAHQGKIEVDSEVGVGTTFSFSLTIGGVH